MDEISNFEGLFCCIISMQINEYQLKCVSMYRSVYRLTSQRLMCYYCSFVHPLIQMPIVSIVSHKSNYKQTLLKHYATIKVTSSPNNRDGISHSPFEFILSKRTETADNHGKLHDLQASICRFPLEITQIQRIKCNKPESNRIKKSIVQVCVKVIEILA